jgi:hypothetical protein
MDKDHLQRLIRKLIEASENLTDMVMIFGENSLQAQEADAIYMAASAQFQRENYWERFCDKEGPWQPECRMYDC